MLHHGSPTRLQWSLYKMLVPKPYPKSDSGHWEWIGDPHLRKSSRDSDNWLSAFLHSTCCWTVGTFTWFLIMDLEKWGSHRGFHVGGFIANIDSKLTSIGLIDHDKHCLWGKSVSFWVVFKLLATWCVADAEMLQHHEGYARSRCLWTGFLAQSHSLSMLLLCSSQPVPSWRHSRSPRECEEEHVEV